MIAVAISVASALGVTQNVPVRRLGISCGWPTEWKRDMPRSIRRRDRTIRSLFMGWDSPQPRSPSMLQAGARDVFEVSPEV